MLRITQNSSADGTHKYFLGYYAEEEVDGSKWYGKAAERLGLNGKIQEKDFEAMCHNINPESGEQLTQRNNKDRTVGYDFTFSVPKSVSLVHALNKDKEILSAFNSAIDQTMVAIEKNAETRVRVNGKQENRNTENLVWATFTHGQSRPVEGLPDPHLHKHVFIFNSTYDEKEGKWKAAQFRNLKADAPLYETLFRSHFADELQNVGYQIERNKNDFEIKGFERSTIGKFSNRTKQIEDKAKELGLIYTEDKASLGAKTRASKLKDLDKEALYNEWKGRLNAKELDLIENAKKSDSGNGGNTITPKEALDYALQHNLERLSTVSEKDIMIHGLKRSYGSVTPNELKDELLKRKDLLSKKDNKGNNIYTTKEALKEEEILKKSARNGRGLMKPINTSYTIQNEKLTHEQANAVQHVLGSKDFITIVSGGAGTGKTWSIKEVAAGVQQKGMAFGAFAPSSAASRQVQRKDGFENATTIADLLQNKKLQEQQKNGVIWIDEAGMVGNKTMNKVIDIAKQQNARILLTGDIKQHNSVERGDALRIIQKYGGIQPARINKIQRQKIDDYRNAVKLISDGKMAEGMKSLDSMRAIKEAGDFQQLKSNVANEYVSSVKSKEDVLIVATTHKQGQMVTNEIRGKLREQKIISGKERNFVSYKNLSFTEAQKKDLANYQEGMSIQFHQNMKGGFKRGSRFNITGRDGKGNILVKQMGAVENKIMALPIEAHKKYSVYENMGISLAKGDKIRITQNGFSVGKQRVNNGNILSVKGFDESGNIIATTGKRNMTLDKNFGNLTHGYYTTSPASQGKSVNRVIVMQSQLSGKAASKEQFYVSASRGKFAISIHTDDKVSLMRSVQRSTQRMTATEIAEAKGNRFGAIKTTFVKLGAIYRSAQSKVANKFKEMHKGNVFKTNFRTPKQVAYAAPTKGK